MITIDDKLFVTKEINAIVVGYAKGIVLRKLLMKVCFGSKQNIDFVTDFIQSLSFYGTDTEPPEIELDLLECLWNFTENLKREELSALHFWILNRKYLVYLDEFGFDDNELLESEFDGRFGRELAYKIYEPNDSNLYDDTIQELKQFLYDFAAELDLSLIDNYTYEQILEEIDNYCV